MFRKNGVLPVDMGGWEERSFGGRLAVGFVVVESELSEDFSVEVTHAPWSVIGHITLTWD